MSWRVWVLLQVNNLLDQTDYQGLLQRRSLWILSPLLRHPLRLPGFPRSKSLHRFRDSRFLYTVYICNGQPKQFALLLSQPIRSSPPVPLHFVPPSLFTHVALFCTSLEAISNCSLLPDLLRHDGSSSVISSCHQHSSLATSIPIHPRRPRHRHHWTYGTTRFRQWLR